MSRHANINNLILYVYNYYNITNIIIYFNKLRIYLNNKHLIIFIIFIKVYKYYILFLNLINKSINY